jgi:predicted nuclease of predicted toxin-antitoxin system
MKLLIDMNLSPRWVDFLQLHAITAVHWSLIGDKAASDREIVAYAQVHGFIVVTNDLDFGHILAATGVSGPSVVQIRSDDLRPETVGKPVLAALLQMRQELADGALITIDPKRTRLRLLPLRR